MNERMHICIIIINYIPTNNTLYDIINYYKL